MLQTTRPAAVAGQFYPGGSRALRAQVLEALAAAAADETPAEPKMLLVPHAGYIYSGSVAAHAYAALATVRKRIRRVVLLGPAHRVAVRGMAAPTVAAFETPLGRIPLDREALAAIAELPQVVADDEAHAGEHSIEVQLPFLQTVLERFTLVPLVVGRADAAEVAEVLERLWGGDETLIVISSDLSHYLPYAQARVVDRGTVDTILRLCPELDQHQACGAAPLSGALLAARTHALAPRLLDLRNSGDTAGDRSHVVGYCAIAFEPRDGRAQRPDDEEAQASADADRLGQALIARCAYPPGPSRRMPHWPSTPPPS